MLAPERHRTVDRVSSFIELHPDGTVSVYSGKVELGTGIATALAQIVAGELGISVDQVRIEMGDTARTPNQGMTAGSKTLQVAGPVLRHAARTARERLLSAAADRVEVATADLVIVDGAIRPRDGSPAFVPLGELADISLDMPIGESHDGDQENSWIGRSVPRTDLRAKLTGAPAYIHDLRLPGMLHGRIVRPWRRVPGGPARIRSVHDRAALAMPGVVAVVRNGDFLGVVAEQEWQAIRAAEALVVEYEEQASLPAEADQFTAMRQAITHDTEPLARGDIETALRAADRTVSATYTFPFQAHASTGPSCAVADVNETGATIWCSSQGVEPLRLTLAPLLGLPAERVRVVFQEGSGCYGQNGADDVAADAALLSLAVGRPVRVQWMRRDEFAWEPKSPAMMIEMTAGLDAAGQIVGWQHTTWTATHTARPGGNPGSLLAGCEIAAGFTRPDPHYGGGNRNAATTYGLPAERVTMHWLPEPPLHTSAMRSLGGLHNTTANECFLDELAHATGVDPVALRLQLTDDPRAVEVIEAVADRAGWGTPLEAEPGLLAGRGFAFARYEGEYTFVAVVGEVSVDPDTGHVQVNRIVVAHDCGAIVNPDGVRNQIEGNVIQGISRSLHEAIHWDDTLQTSLTWETYRILTFAEVPYIETVLIDRPHEPSWGAGEPAICPVTAAIGNAIFDATGVRLRDVPLTSACIQASLARSAHDVQ